MTPLFFTVKRLNGFLEEIRSLKESEFPYPHSKEALVRLEEQVEANLRTLARLKEQSDPRTVQLLCSQSLTVVVRNMPLLGFILRSTNVRNAFEVYWPLLRLSRKVLEPEATRETSTTKLILSSEWNYSPLTYTEVPNLKGFVLIGLPAHESANPLLIPLAGHELGHSLWINGNLSSEIVERAKNAIGSVFDRRWEEYKAYFHPTFTSFTSFKFEDLTTLASWQKANEWACTQAEETFCDFVGILLFGRAYLFAFAYLLSPYHSGPRSPRYPNLKARVKNILYACAQAGYGELPAYDALFSNFTEPAVTEGDKFQLEVADEVTEILRDELFSWAASFITYSGVVTPTEAETERISKVLTKTVPASNAASLADIVNAGWVLYNRIESGAEPGLKELLLKNIEVFEIEQIMIDAATAGSDEEGEVRA